MVVNLVDFILIKDLLLSEKLGDANTRLVYS